MRLGWSHANAVTFSQVPFPTHPGLAPARRDHEFRLQGKLCFPLGAI